jgi:hypothetical protein
LTCAQWLAEQCHLLEKRNLSLRKEVRQLAEVASAHAAEADKLRLQLAGQADEMLSLQMKAGGSAKREERLQAKVAALEGTIRDMQARAAETWKERRTESRILGEATAGAVGGGGGGEEGERHNLPRYDPTLASHSWVRGTGTHANFRVH